MMVGASALFAVTSLLAKALGRGLDGAPLCPLQVSAGRWLAAGIAVAGALILIRPGAPVRDGADEVSGA